MSFVVGSIDLGMDATVAAAEEQEGRRLLFEEQRRRRLERCVPFNVLGGGFKNSSDRSDPSLMASYSFAAEATAAGATAAAAAAAAAGGTGDGVSTLQTGVRSWAHTYDVPVETAWPTVHSCVHQLE